MTRKDYELLASAIRPVMGGLDQSLSRALAIRIAGNIADALAKDNPRFDRWKFLSACGLTDSEQALI